MEDRLLEVYAELALTLYTPQKVHVVITSLITGRRDVSSVRPKTSLERP